MLVKFYFLLLLVLAAEPVWAQSGCTDPQATNYNPAAVSNNGSCQYPVTTTDVTLKADLADEVSESSGLQYTGGKLWTFNDSGNPPVLFRVDSTSGQVLQRVRITNFDNVDWEDIAANAQYLYVGDFGNNNGTRRDLRVLRVAKADLGAAVSTATAQAIEFSYPDQTDFSPRTNRHNFDCEAFFYANDSLHLFTKNWVDLQTRYYTIPAVPGTYVAHLKGTFNVQGLITAADLNPNGTVAGLLGYNATNGVTFLWLLSDFKTRGFLQGNKRRLELPNALVVGQAEGLTFVDRYRVLLSNERLTTIFTIPARLYGLSIGNWLAPTVLAAKATSQAGMYTITPNPAHHSLRIERPATTNGAATLALYDLRGRVVLTLPLPAGQLVRELDLAPLTAGEYLLKVQSGQKTFSQKVVVQ